jgi:hypothetical protein
LEQYLIPYTKILDHFICEDESIDCNKKYITNIVTKESILNENIEYIQCLYQDDEFSKYIKNYSEKDIYFSLKDKLKIQINSLIQLRIRGNDLNKFISKSLIIDYGTQLNKVLKFLSKQKEFAKDNQYLKYAFIISEYVSQNYLIYNQQRVKIKYNPFMQFGRFGSYSESFNILSLDKNLRHNLYPESVDYEFLEFDYNAFEIRTLLAVLKINQPPGDLYDLLHKKSNDQKTRAEFKAELITSIYSGKEKNTVLYLLMKQKNFYKLYPIINEKVMNVFGKEMQTDEFHLLSRILQSSAAYIIYMQMIKLLRFIVQNNLKSKISFCVYDSVCISLHKDEKCYIPEFRNILESVSIDEIDYHSTMPVKPKIGPNYGSLKEIEICQKENSSLNFSNLN